MRVLPANKPLRAWSAGCATGEEAWTLAILLAAEAGDRFEILATDLSEGALTLARAGRYPASALDEIPPAVRQRWFSIDGPSAAVVDALRARVRFELHNLADPSTRYKSGFDLILCRNVLIYFDDSRRGRVIERLAASLAPGGYLFLGYSETLRAREDLFERVESDAGPVYRRRERPVAAPPVVANVPHDAAPPPPIRPAAPAPPPSWRAAGQRAATLPASPPPAPRVPVRLSGSYEEDAAERLTRELKPVVDGAAHAIDLDGASFLGDEAARVLARVAETAHGRLALRCTRAAVRRWIARHRLDGKFAVEGEVADE